MHNHKIDGSTSSSGVQSESTANSPPAFDTQASPMDDKAREGSTKKFEFKFRCKSIWLREIAYLAHLESIVPPYVNSIRPNFIHIAHPITAHTLNVYIRKPHST